MTEVTTPSSATSRIIDPRINIRLANGKSLIGQLEHFVTAQSLVLFDDENLAPKLLTVPEAEAPDAHAALGADEVLLRNWTDMRGAPADLADHGTVELTGQEVSVGPFRLQALVARML